MERMWVLLAFALLACGDKPTSMTLILSGSGVVAPRDVDRLEVRIRGESGTMASGTYMLRSDFPQTVVLRPVANALSETVTIEVDGFRGGDLRIRKVLQSSMFVAMGSVSVNVVLDAACLDRVCSAGGCSAGMCANDPDGSLPDGGDAAPDARIDSGMDGGDSTMDAGDSGSAGALLLTEYLEGSGNDKAVEITNVGNAAAALDGCVLAIYSNGSMLATLQVPLSGSLLPRAATSICLSTGSASLVCNLRSGNLNFNGDDALELRCGATLIDSIGQVGSRAWAGIGMSQEVVLRRRCGATPDNNSSDTWAPLSWDILPATEVSGLGQYTCP